MQGDHIMRKPLMAGNWKMYKTAAEARSLARGLRAQLDGRSASEVVVCPPFTDLTAVAEELKGSSLAWGAQNAHWEKQGAFTGEVAAVMLAEAGCRYVIVGHSERRQYFSETDALVNKRMHGVLAAGLVPIVCIGETLQEREANTTLRVIERQMNESLAGLKPPTPVVVAYEPVWAIGTGKTGHARAGAGGSRLHPQPFRSNSTARSRRRRCASSTGDRSNRTTSKR